MSTLSLSNLAQVTGSGDVATGVRKLRSITLTPAAAVATVVVKDGSGGSAVLSLQAAANGNSVQWRAGADGVQFATAINLTLIGVGAIVVVEYN
jgi:hypothetical protein